MAYKETVEPEKQFTRIIPDYEVNIIAAVILMPRNASYMYEVISGGAKISYAYEITAFNENDQKIYNKLIRNNISETYKRCQNQRIQNVFGGVEKATFIANKNMERECNNGNSDVDIDALRLRINYEIIDGIRLILPIQTALKAGISYY